MEYQLKLRKDIIITDNIQQILLQQIQGLQYKVYGNEVKRLQIIPFKKFLPRQKEEATADDSYNINESSFDPVWYKIRQYLINCYGKNVGKVLFSKLTMVKKDAINSKVTLKPETNL